MVSGLWWLWALSACSPVHRIPAPEPPPSVLPPTAARSQYLRGQILAAGGDLDGAEYSLSRARIFDADEPRILMALGSVKMTRGDVNGARAILSEAVRIAPDDGPAWLAHGRLEMAFGDKALGRVALQRAISLGQSWQARAMLVADSLRSGSSSGLPSALVDWVAQPVNDPIELRRRGELRLAAGDSPGALSDLLEALRGSRQDASLVASVVRAATIGRQISAAMIAADVLVAEDSSAVGPWLLLGALSGLIGDHEYTLHSLERAGALGAPLGAAERASMASAQRALASVPARAPVDDTPSEGILSRSLRLMEQQRWDAAEDTVRRALEEQSNDPQLLYVLAQVYLERDGAVAAAPYVETLVDVAPDFSPGHNLWAWVYAEKGERLEEAERYSRRALRQQPRIGSYWDTLGWILLRQERYDAAMPILERALRLSPNDDAVRARRDSCRALLGGTHP